MRLTVDKRAFLHSWQRAERNIGTTSTISTLSGIRCEATEEQVILQSTDLKTSITCTTKGATVDEPGEVILPVRAVGELFKKIPDETFSMEAGEHRITINAGGSRYTFTLYSAEDFPPFHSSGEARPFITLPIGEFQRLLEEGTFAGLTGDKFPQYLSGACIDRKQGSITLAATDSLRLSLARYVAEGEVPEEPSRLILPNKSLRDLHWLLATVEDDTKDVVIKEDDAQAYFILPELEFSVRKLDTMFPNYEEFLTDNITTTLIANRETLIGAVERADLVVKNFSRMVMFYIETEQGCHITADAPDVGEAVEYLDTDIEGQNLRIAFNSRYLLDGLKALHGERVLLSFNGQEGQMTMSRPGTEEFCYVLMPINLNETDSAHYDPDAY
ncbi:MAG: DNA polymerase III subunit beta [Synergistales bacterium]|nr:DNA polymerase III subunit beta [Synergistales bacterium]